MCGIFGIIDRKLNTEDNLKKMSDAIYHRGPDEQTWVIKNDLIGYGMDRLSIIDRAGGTQPISNEDGTIEVIYNGEIYNHKELREKLKKLGHKFKTTCDTEILVHLYEQYGTQFISKLRGMFAFCIYDSKKQILFLARDHMGIKPLYYRKMKNVFHFGSEIKALTAIQEDPLDPTAITTYFTYRYILGPHTIYSTVKSLPAAHQMVYDIYQDTLKIDRWWTLDLSPIEVSYKKAKEQVKDLLIQAVSRRLESEVPLGAFLSGGVDSSLICAIVAKVLQHDINVYNIGYNEVNEYGYAGSVSRDLGFNYYQCHMSFDDVVASLEKVLYHMDQPLSDAACFPTLFLSHIVKKGCTVMMSGEGADEIFAGYWQYDGILQNRPPKDTSMAAMIDFQRRSSYYPDQHGIITQKSLKQFSPQDTIQYWYSDSLLQSCCNYDIHTWLSDDLLMKVDKMTMSASVETRVPFLDMDLMEYVCRLPDQYKYNQCTTKRILKDIAEDVGVSSNVVRRPKMGFSVPLDQLLRGPFKQGFLDDLRSQKFRSLSYLFDFNRVDDIISRYYQGQSDLYLICWVLFIFTSWFSRSYR